MPLKRIMPALLLAVAAAPAQAGGYEAFIGGWDYAAGGQIEQSGSTVSLDKDSGIHTNSQVLGLLRYRSDGGWIPDVGAGYVHLGAAGTYQASSTFSIGGIPITKGHSEVGAGVNINDFQASLDWRLYNGHGLRLAGGASLEYLGGHANFSGTQTSTLAGVPLPGGTQQERRFVVDQPVPIPHLRLEAQPWPRLHLDLSGGYIEDGEQHVAEVHALAQLRLWWQLWASAGYQYQDYRVNANPYVLEARVSGPLLGVSIASW